MEVDYDELKRVVEDAEFKPWEKLAYAGLNYLLFPSDELSEREKKERAPPVFFRPSTVADWDIYFTMGEIDERFRKPVLLHEILEVERFREFDKSGLPIENPLSKAHGVAMDYDNRYARESLSDKDYADYCSFVEKVRSDA